MAVSASSIPVWEIMLGAQCSLFLFAGMIVLVWMTRPADRLDAMLDRGMPEETPRHEENRQA